MKGKNLVSLFGSIFVLLLIFIPLNTFRHRYDYESREVLSIQNSVAHFSFEEPTNDVFGYIVMNSDLIIEGTITSSGNTGLRTMPGTEESKYPYQLTTTTYTLRVDDVWFGEYDRQTLTLEILGDATSGVTKPHKNDKGIFILSKYGAEGNYTLTAAESSIFVKNPPNNGLFAFSTVEAMSEFDHKKSSDLKAAIEEKLKLVELGKVDGMVYGAIGREYKSLTSSIASEVVDDK